MLVLGGGLSGMGVAHALAQAGWTEVTILERGSELGGLAGTFQRGEYYYPLAYHHILHRDRVLHYFLDAVGAMSRVRWRKINMLFSLDGQLYNLAAPVDFLRFPMSFGDKLRFVRLMTKAFRKSDWRDWHDRSAADLVDAWGGPGVRRAIFERLSRLKFNLPCEAVSGAWLGARLHFREGSAPLGYVPGVNWTKLLCDGVTRLLRDQGVAIRVRTSVARLLGANDRITEVQLDTDERLQADLFVSTLPTEIYVAMVPHEHTAHLRSIRYTAVVSAICATRQTIEPDFYWMNLASLDRSACGIFLLNSLNPTIGAPGDTCVNFVTHVPSRHDDFFRRSDEALWTAYGDDFRTIFGFDLEPFWTHISRLPMYSPVFIRGYDNPPIHSATWRNAYLAGNYRTFPSIASTGTALMSGLETAQAILRDHGADTDLPAAAAGFRLPSMPRD